MLSRPNQFIAKLYEMLQTADDSVVAWLPDGRSFKFRNTERFVDEVLSSYFALKKLGDFQAQLKRYGFENNASGRYFHVYSHDLFRKENPELLEKIKARRMSKAGKPVVVGPRYTSIIEDEQMSDMESSPTLPVRAESIVSKPLLKSDSNGTLDDEKVDELSVVTPERVCLLFGPLTVPGRLRHQPATAPASLRFLPMPDRSMHRQMERYRWTKPLELGPITSTELDGSNWEKSSTDEKPSSAASLKVATVRPKSLDKATPNETLENMLLLLR